MSNFPTVFDPTTFTDDDLVSKVEQATGRRLDPLHQAVGAGKAFLMLDTSSSMGGVKLSQAKDGARSYAEQAIKLGYQVGFIAFHSDAQEILSPTDHLDQIKEAVQKFVAGGSTNMAQAFEMAIEKLADHKGSKAICVVTDGYPDDRPPVEALAKQAKDLGVHITTVPCDFSDATFLELLASQGGAMPNVDASDLGQAITDAARLLPPPDNDRFKN